MNDRRPLDAIADDLERALEANDRSAIGRLQRELWRDMAYHAGGFESDRWKRLHDVTRLERAGRREEARARFSLIYDRTTPPTDAGRMIAEAIDADNAAARELERPDDENDGYTPQRRPE